MKTLLIPVVFLVLCTSAIIVQAFVLERKFKEKYAIDDSNGMSLTPRWWNFLSLFAVCCCIAPGLSAIGVGWVYFLAEKLARDPLPWWKLQSWLNLPFTDSLTLLPSMFVFGVFLCFIPGLIIFAIILYRSLFKLRTNCFHTCLIVFLVLILTAIVIYMFGDSSANAWLYIQTATFALLTSLAITTVIWPIRAWLCIDKFFAKNQTKLLGDM